VIKEVFGDHARKLAISSTKSMHGHVMGATGAVEMAATIQAIDCGVIPPTANYTQPDPECDLDYVPNQARGKPVRVAISNSFAFGGLNAVLLVRKFE
jgi:nodulation protein E